MWQKRCIIQKNALQSAALASFCGLVEPIRLLHAGGRLFFIFNSETDENMQSLPSCSTRLYQKQNTCLHEQRKCPCLTLMLSLTINVMLHVLTTNRSLLLAATLCIHKLSQFRHRSNISQNKQVQLCADFFLFERLSIWCESVTRGKSEFSFSRCLGNKAMHIVVNPNFKIDI